MPKRPKLSRENKRVQIVTLRNEGFSVKEISERTNSDRRTIQRICKRVNQTNSFKDKPRSGRPQILGEREKRIVTRTLKKSDSKNAESVRKIVKAENGIDVSRDTIARVLKEAGFVARIKIKKPSLNDRQKKARLAWARDHSKWTSDDWKKVIWSDESKFQLLKSDGKEYVWVNQSQRSISDEMVTPTKKFGGGSVMVWSCMTWKGIGFSCKIDETMDGQLYTEILRKELSDTIEYYKFNKNEIIFQHDNDPKHTSKISKENLKDLKLKVMEWPSQSPDLNPIEHFWDHVSRQLKSKHSLFATKNQLWEEIQEILKEENENLCKKLISTMQERVIDVIKAKGGYTRW